MSLNHSDRKMLRATRYAELNRIFNVLYETSVNSEVTTLPLSLETSFKTQAFYLTEIYITDNRYFNLPASFILLFISYVVPTVLAFIIYIII